MSHRLSFIARNSQRRQSRPARTGCIEPWLRVMSALLISLLIAACTRPTPTTTPTPELRTFDVVVSNTSGRSLRDAQVIFEGLAQPHGGTLVRRGERRKPAHHGPWPRTAKVSWRNANAGGAAERIEAPVQIPPAPQALAAGQHVELRFEFDGEKVVPKVLPPSR